MRLAKLKDAIRKQPWIRKYAKLTRLALRRSHEPEIELLRFIVDPVKLAIDVGANNGEYTYYLTKLGARVLAFEPVPDLAADLDLLFGRQVKVVAAAVSSSTGTATLRIPRISMNGGMAHGLATIETHNSLGGANFTELEIPKIALDDMTIDSVGFIKIDVEGHEYEVLLGALKILERYRPVLLIEAEERHRPGAIDSICRLLTPLGYYGLVLDEGHLLSIQNFDPNLDQNVPSEYIAELNRGLYRGRYINNFLFIP